MATHNGVYYNNSTGLNLRTNTTTRINIATNGVVEFNESYSFPTSDGSSNEVLLTNGTGTLSFSTIPNASLDNSSVTVTGGNGLTGGGSVSLGSSVTLNVGAGTLIDVDGSNVNVDLSELTTSTTNGDGDFFVVVDSSNGQKKLTKGNINNSGFNNDAGFTTNTGTVTSVDASGGTGISVTGGPITGSGSFTITNTSPDTGVPAILSNGSVPSLNTGISASEVRTLIGAGTSSTVGTVTSIAISGTDGIDVDSGSPITSSGTITLGLSNVPNTSLANSSIDIAGSDISLGGQITGDDIISDVSAGQITNTQLANSSITINGSAIALGGSVNVGDITAVTAGNGLTGGGTSGALTLNVGAGTLIDVAADTVSVDLSELVTSTSDGDGDFFVVVDSANAQKKLTKANINNSGFNNDAGFTTNTGTVTSIAITGTDGIDVDSGSPITGSGTITLGLSSIPNSSLANSSITIAGSATSLGGTITADAIIGQVGAGEILISQLEENSITINGTSVSLGGTINVGDITSVTAGNGLTGGGTTGAVTLNVVGGTGILANANDIALDYAGADNFVNASTDLEGTAIASTDTIIYHDATDNNVKKGLVSDLPFTSSAGSVTSVAISGSDGIDVDSGSPITSSGTIALGLSNVPNSSLANSSVTVTAGSGLANGGSVSLGGSVTLNVGAGTGIQVNANDIALDYAGTDNYIYAAGTGTGDITTSMYIPVSDASNNVKKYTVAALPFTNNQGTVTSVGITAGALIDVSNTPITTNGNITVAVDLSELTTSTSNGDGDFFVVVDSSNNQKKLTKANINNSGFNNDAGYITSAGNTNIYSSDGSITASRNLSQDGHVLGFQATEGEHLSIFKTSSTPIQTPRLHVEADDAYSEVLELYSNSPITNIIAGYEQGQAKVFNVDAQGNLTATSKAFDIPHPDPIKKKEGVRLKHGNLEGPEHGVYVRGRMVDDKTIELPEHWKHLVDENSITVQLTSNGKFQSLYVKKIEDWVVHIGNGNLFSNKIDCYYFIQAERKDVNKIEVEYRPL